METNTAARIRKQDSYYRIAEIRKKATREGGAPLLFKSVFSVFQRTPSDFVRAEPALDGVRYHIPADAFFSLAGYAGGYKAFVHVKYKLRYVFRLFSVSKIYSADMRNINNA